MSKAKIQSGSIVMLREDYHGYWKHFKGRELTVMQRIPRDISIDQDALTILEFDGINLTGIDNFVFVRNDNEVKNETTNNDQA